MTGSLGDAGPASGATERAVAAFGSTMRGLFGSLPDGEWHEERDLVRYATGLGAARLNGIWVVGPGASEESAASWLTELERRGLPRCVIARPRAPGWTTDLAARHLLTRVEHEPFMLHTDPGAVVVPDTPVTTRVAPDDDEAVRLARQVFVEGFEGPDELIGWMMSPPVLSVPGNAAWLGRVEGVACTVGFGSVVGDHVGVFNIATPPAHRRRGHGNAVTARVVAEGFAVGARTAYLQASELGYPVYERMGFRTVETWPSHYPPQ
ncbi:GNAT family N-acetyltransferase [Oryzobacter telluris]|uniref:GNAT family N-acetyltransferase n=1 Tax=Oryzobacter telluris TaxID=3149179 RepID=UPI00370DDFE3